MQTQILDNEKTRHETLCGCGDADSIRVGFRLDSGRDIRCFPEYFSDSRFFLANHHFAGMDSDSHGNTFSIFSFDDFIKRTDFLDRSQPGQDSSFRIIFVRLWETKKDKDSIP